MIVVLLGMFLGSFSTAIIYRTRHGQSWVWNVERKDKARSFCPSCRHTLSVRDLIPVLSWCCQKGRCRYCQGKIPNSYLLLELSSIALCLVVWGGLGWTAKGWVVMFLIPFVVSQFVLFVHDGMLSKLLIFLIVIGAVSTAVI